MTTPVSKDDFAKLVMDRIHQAGEKGDIIYQPEEFCLRGNAGTMSLANAYAEFCAADEDLRERVVKSCVRNWFVTSKNIPEEFEDAKPDLLPVVRSRSHFEHTGQFLENGEPVTWPCEVLGEHFGIGLVYDLPESMMFFHQATLDAWGLTFHAVLEAALENLLSLPAAFIRPKSKGVYLLAADDNYNASRLLLTDAIRQLQVKGDPIAMIPNRKNLIVAGSDDVEGLAGMVKLAANALEEPRPISGIALRLDGDEWKPWLPPPSHPSFNAFRGLALQTLGQDYAKQEVLLNKLHEKTDEGVLVAEFMVLKSPAGSFWTLATCVAENTLLPMTDLVVFAPPTGEALVPVEWQKVVDVVGDLMEPLDIYPPRYRLKEFPSETQLASMRIMLN